MSQRDEWKAPWTYNEVEIVKTKVFWVWMEVVGWKRSYFINSELKERNMEWMYCISHTIFLSCLGLFSFVFGQRLPDKGIKWKSSHSFLFYHLFLALILSQSCTKSWGFYVLSQQLSKLLRFLTLSQTSKASFFMAVWPFLIISFLFDYFVAGCYSP